ncbi:MAG: Asp-tRNA(Asn)/Glu-tRNA(Gln) amidotransferase subunit GatB [Planctomycetes bacterium]|nr:Asp-tRNA(Asn)/Glu-tRNA(Gln) amidotransferase subunit GatB [Planctomycetota bacterium]MCW8134951.1 Asp-tRNA(Asn)/Glu-tRNA(Gln) amidotransferase subunit GatB [Planctomycetota bacterium]
MTTATQTDFEPVIGLEVHVQLKTRSKMFCRCEVRFGAPANSLTCPVCLGLPGALPTVNRQAIEHGIRIGLALNCQIAHRVKFDRKNYFYPDLPKGYQVSQYDEPLCFDGELQMPIMDASGNPKICRITRAHLEEDAGKSIHMGHSTLVDLNRAGTPLVEIVGGPDLRSPEEAYVYLTTLKRNLSYLGVSDLSMEKGSLRCDANVSVRPRGQEKFGVRSEIKNLNSFRAVRAALEFEIRRHVSVVEGGGKLTQETRLWDEEKLETRSLRSKEEATDYRFFPEPDLTTFDVPRDWVQRVQATLPEMPEKRLLRFLHDFKLNRADAEFLVGDKELADWYEAVLKLYDEPRKVAAWVVVEVNRELQERHLEISQLPVTPERLVELIKLLDAGKLNNITAKEVFKAMAETGEGAMATAKRLGRLIEQDEGEVDRAIEDVITEFKDKAVADYLRGETKVLGFLVGQAMRKLKGKANPKDLGQKLEAALKQKQEPGAQATG